MKLDDKVKELDALAENPLGQQWQFVAALVNAWRTWLRDAALRGLENPPTRTGARMTKLAELARRLETYASDDSVFKDSASKLREAEALLHRIRASINTNGELSVLCMQDIDALLGPR